MFDSSSYHGQDLLFKDATIRVVPVGEKTTYRDWLGPDYVVALEGMLSQQCSGTGRAGWQGHTPQKSGHNPRGILPSLSPQTLSELKGALRLCKRSR